MYTWKNCYHFQPLRTYFEFFCTYAPFVDLIDAAMKPPGLYHNVKDTGKKHKNPPTEQPLLALIEKVELHIIKIWVIPLTTTVIIIKFLFEMYRAFQKKFSTPLPALHSVIENGVENFFFLKSFVNFKQKFCKILYITYLH